MYKPVLRLVLNRAAILAQLRLPPTRSIRVRRPPCETRVLGRRFHRVSGYDVRVGEKVQAHGKDCSRGGWEGEGEAVGEREEGEREYWDWREEC